MLGNLAASKAAKLATLCICPVGAAVVTTQVPQVRSAVHRMTAPKAPARRLAPRAPVSVAKAPAAIAAPCPTTIPAVALAEQPLALASLPVLSSVPFDPALPPLAANQPFTPSDGPIILTTPPAPPFGTNTPALPEPATWVQLGVGFAVVGGIIRSSRVRAKIIPTRQEAAA